MFNLKPYCSRDFIGVLGLIFITEVIILVVIIKQISGCLSLQ